MREKKSPWQDEDSLIKMSNVIEFIARERRGFRDSRVVALTC